MKRRQFLLSAGALGLSLSAYAGLKVWPEQGFTNPCLNGLPDDLKHHSLMRQIWSGITPQNVWDSHVHLVGVGDSESGIWFNPSMDSYWHPILKVQKNYYMNGSCAVTGDVDNSTVLRMADLAAEMPTGFKLMLFAFDWFHDENGVAIKDSSVFYIPNEYARKVAAKHSQYFEWVCSIHPYRADAVTALDAAVKGGARAIKWLPQGMGIDPASPKCDAFYAACKHHNIPIICHTGRESAVQGGNQEDANPLKLRRALDAGVRVILAHCASDGEDIDYDNGNKKVKSFALFLRLMDEPKYKDLLFGEISAIILFNHAWAIEPLLQRTDLHARLLNGSDYPLPGIMPLVSLKQLVGKQLLTDNEADFLKQIRLYNPLLFDFALKRLIKFNGISFPTNIFETRHFFEAV